MRTIIYIVILLFLFQPDLTGQVPDPPTFRSVSVDNLSGYTQFHWSPSPSPEVDAYIIFKWDDIPPDFGWQTIDTIWGHNSVFYEWVSLNGTLRSEAYVMSAVDTNAVDPQFDKESELTDPHRTMFFPKMEFNPCNGKMEMEWIGYHGWNDSLSHYVLYRQQNGGLFETLISATNDTTFIDEDVISYSKYCYYVEAVHLDGRTSTSYVFCDSVSSKRPPDYIYGNGSRFINEQIVELSFNTDINSELENYILIRANPGSSEFDTIQRISFLDGTIMEIRDTVYEAGSFSYYLLSMNECGKEALRSNLINLIWLEVSNKNFLNYLDWSQFQEWLAGIESYNIYRSIGDNPALMIGSQEPPDTSYTDNTEDIIYSSEGQFCYQIEAVEMDGNPMGFKGVSWSNQVCIEFEPRIFMPNAFTPNGDGLNEEFKPVLSFTPVEYSFTIRNRWGNTLFLSDNYEEAWDGTHSGKKVPQGIYLYYIRTVAPQGSVIEKSGQVSVLYPNN